jgi:catechol 2,3-dioxygenase
VTTEQKTETGVPAAPAVPERVDHLVINVTDMERSHEFWSGVLGFRQCGEIQRPGVHMRFYRGTSDTHHDLALSQVQDVSASRQSEAWSMQARRSGLNHVAIRWPTREAWLQQLAWLQSKGVKFIRRVDHGMSHSVYIADPDGHGIEVLYELPEEVWSGDVNAALNYAVPLPTEGPEALQDSTEYKVFGNDGG